MGAATFPAAAPGCTVAVPAAVVWERGVVSAVEIRVAAAVIADGVCVGRGGGLRGDDAISGCEVQRTY